jgi:hypothetical protein
MHQANDSTQERKDQKKVRGAHVDNLLNACWSLRRVSDAKIKCPSSRAICSRKNNAHIRQIRMTSPNHCAYIMRQVVHCAVSSSLELFGLTLRQRSSTHNQNDSDCEMHAFRSLVL